MAHEHAAGALGVRQIGTVADDDGGQGLVGLVADRDGGAAASGRRVQPDIGQPVGARGLGLDRFQRRQPDQGVAHLVEIGGIIAPRRQHPALGGGIGDIERPVMGDDMDAGRRPSHARQSRAGIRPA